MCNIKHSVQERKQHILLKITFKSPSVQLSHADISAGELHRHHSIEVPHEEATLRQQSAITFRGANNLVLQLLPPSTTSPDRLTLDQPHLCGAEVQSRKSTIENRSFRLTFYHPEDSAKQYTAQCGMCPWIFVAFHNYTAFILCLM